MYCRPSEAFHLYMNSFIWAGESCFWKITLQALNTQSWIKLERTSVLLLAKYPFQYINISKFSNFLPEHDDLDLAKRFKSPPLPRKKTGISLVISFFNRWLRKDERKATTSALMRWARYSLIYNDLNGRKCCRVEENGQQVAVITND